jgi:hypothetical protein
VCSVHLLGIIVCHIQTNSCNSELSQNLESAYTKVLSSLVSDSCSRGNNAAIAKPRSGRRQLTSAVTHRLLYAGAVRFCMPSYAHFGADGKFQNGMLSLRTTRHTASRTFHQMFAVASSAR